MVQSMIPHKQYDNLCATDSLIPPVWGKTRNPDVQNLISKIGLHLGVIDKCVFIDIFSEFCVFQQFRILYVLAHTLLLTKICILHFGKDVRLTVCAWLTNTLI